MENEEKKPPSPEEIQAKNEYELANFKRWPEYQEYAMEHKWRIDNGFLPFESEVLSLAEWRKHLVSLGGLKDRQAVYLKENKRKLAEQREREKEERQRE